MKSIHFLLGLLACFLFGTCQITNDTAKKSNSDEAVILVLNYFIKKIVPEEDHFNSHEFNYDFMVLEGIGAYDDLAMLDAWKNSHLAKLTEDSIYVSLGGEFTEKEIIGKSSYPQKIKGENEWKFSRRKYTKQGILSGFYILPQKDDLFQADTWLNETAEIYLGAEQTVKLPSGNQYKRVRIQVIYAHKDKMCDKSYFFILRNNKIEYIKENYKNQSRLGGLGKTLKRPE